MLPFGRGGCSYIIMLTQRRFDVATYLLYRSYIMDIIKDLLKGPIDNLVNFIDREFRQTVSNRILEYVAEEYKRSYYTKTILHRTAPVKLVDFYQPLFIRPFGERNENEKIPTHSVKALFKDKKSMTILGTAGSGKSTIIKSLLVNCIQESFKVPIRIELRYLNKYNGSLHQYIEEEVFNLEQLSVDKQVTKRLLHAGDFLFFFDGYDELSSGVKERITKDINDFTRIYANNPFLLTSRPYCHVELLAEFSNFEVCELSGEEIEQFVRKQIPANETEIVERIVEGINIGDRKSYATFLSNPLLLSMFILTFQTYSTVPPKRSTFYRQVFDSLFHSHDSISKLSFDREKKSGLSKEQFEQVLKLFSYISFSQQVFVFDQDYLESILNKIKKAKKNLQFDNQHLIDDLQTAICILYKEGIDYVFPHRSLQEFFASLYIANLEPQQKKEAYRKLLLQFFDAAGSLLGQNNFFSLLTEQDEIGMITYFSLPFWEKMQEVLKPRISQMELEDLHMDLSAFIFSCHYRDKRFEELYFHLEEYESRWNSIYLKSRVGGRELLFVAEERTEMNDLVNEFVARHKVVISKIIKFLNEDLKDAVESDNSIIEMV